MKWKHEEWTINNLLEKYNKQEINLSPSYQRNPIWTAKAQRLLIDTILTPQPLPNFFIRILEKGKYEMVDGQQRARTMIAFRNGEVSTSTKEYYDSLKDKTHFNNFVLNVTVIYELEKGESIEEYYSLVNRAGLRLNTPELRKAEFYDTSFLKLASRLAGSDTFASLNLFSEGTIKRMNDVELVYELLALLLCGVSEKKKKVKELFEDDISTEQVVAAEDSFNAVVDVIAHLNSITAIKHTRYRQRADLYTLVEFIHSHNKLQKDVFAYYYRILLAIAPGITPSQKRCDPLRDYARNCVSQSNSLIARQERGAFFQDLLRHNSFTPNPLQLSIIDYFEFPPTLTEFGGAWTITLPEAE